ncbi:DUF4271 domain-containing protein [Segatella maculosa]|uniref:DUF4271 domain-containing protein n=1 Tax=Segatella maculosa TaxID=439703 RepID=UPI0028D40418|nr:DUF4271 domain-containing protein [Segatella maculosa]
MIQQGDSIAQAALSEGVPEAEALVHRQPTPAEVLSWLPKNATPAQQDSAIQAHIKPSEIHWSSRPDTLHLPGQPVGKSWRDVSLPKYYKESFFSRSPLFHPELPGGRMGVAGDPIPYSVAADNVITGLLLACFVIGIVAFRKSRGFIGRQAKHFFYVQHGETTAVTETASELRFQFFLMLQTCLQLALLFFFHTRATLSDTFIVDQYQVIGWFSGAFLVYFLLKIVIYTVTNLTFFDRKRNEQWLKSILFIVSIEGLLLFPASTLVAYFGLQVGHAVVYTFVVIVLLKIMLFCKSYLIFFKQNGSYVQNILYFCTLEVMPVLALWGTLATINAYLKINF